MIAAVLTWLNDPAHWRSTRFDVGIWEQLGTHLRYSVIALVIALAIGIPVGLVLGHSRRAGWIVSVTNAARALPTVGILVLLVVLIAPHFTGRTDIGYVIPTIIVLVLLALPPVMSTTYAGMLAVPPEIRDAAYGMGMTDRQVLWRVELPNALPLIFSGVRSAALQVIATTTIAAYVTLGGLGRFIYDGLAQQDYPQMIGGAVLVAVLAVLTDLVLAALQRLTVSRGVSARYRKSPTKEIPA